MEVVNTLDIDGTQWEMQDVQARQGINTLKVSSEQRFKELNIALDNKANKSYVEENFANKNEVVKNEVTSTTFINSDNIIFKQGKICIFSITRMYLNKTYSNSEELGVIGDPAFYPKKSVRGLVIKLNDAITAEIIIKENGTVIIGQAGALTPGYWIGSFSWVTE